MSSPTILQLNPSIPVVTPDGKGEAIGWIDYGKDDDLLWIVFLQKTGECWIYPNPEIRACPNVTLGRLPGVSSEALRQSIQPRMEAAQTTGQRKPVRSAKTTLSSGASQHNGAPHPRTKSKKKH